MMLGIPKQESTMMSQVRVCFLAIAVVMSARAARADDVVRFATYNVSMFRSEEGELLRDLQGEG